MRVEGKDLSGAAVPIRSSCKRIRAKPSRSSGLRRYSAIPSRTNSSLDSATILADKATAAAHGALARSKRKNSRAPIPPTSHISAPKTTSPGRSAQTRASPCSPLAASATTSHPSNSRSRRVAIRVSAEPSTTKPATVLRIFLSSAPVLMQRLPDIASCGPPGAPEMGNRNVQIRARSHAQMNRSNGSQHLFGVVRVLMCYSVKEAGVAQTRCERPTAPHG